MNVQYVVEASSQCTKDKFHIETMSARCTWVQLNTQTNDTSWQTGLPRNSLQNERCNRFV